MSFPRSKPLKYILITLSVMVLVLALALGAFRLAVTRVPEYRVQLQEWVSDKTGLVIEFSGIRARLRQYGPELVFDDAIVRTPDRTRVLASARRGSVGFDLWTSITELRLTAGRFTLDAPEIAVIRTREGRIRLLGQGSLPEREAKPIAVDALPVGEFRVRNAVVSFRDEITGRGPWSLSGINFTLARQTDLLQLNGHASLPEALGKALEFSGRVEGDLGDVDSLNSRFTVQGRDLDLAGWADVMPNQWFAPETGQGSIILASTLRGTQLTAAEGRVDLHSVSTIAPAWVTPLPGPDPLVPPPDDDAPACEPACAHEHVANSELEASQPTEPHQPAAPALISFDRLALNFKAQRTGDRWSAAISDLDLSRKNSPWQSKQVSVQWSNPQGGSREFGLEADRVVLGNLWPVLAYLPESAASAKLRALQARGTIDNLSLRVSQPSQTAPVEYSINADLSDLATRPVANIPGVSGITAHIEGSDALGAARIDSKDVVFELPRMFREPLAARSATGDVRWEKVAEGWRIRSDSMRVATDDGNAQARVAVTIPRDKSSPILDLEATGDDLRAVSTPKYLPANKLSPKALAWLDQAFADGRVRDASFILKGPTRAMPFRKGEGQFIARGRIEGGVLNYQPGWPEARELAAQFEFRNQGMKVHDATAEVAGLKASRIRGAIADFKVTRLTMRAHANGDLAHGLTLLQNSPLREALGPQFQSLRGNGALQADIELDLPLKRLADRRTLVTARLADATVRGPEANAPITALSGHLTVRQSLPESAALEGIWLDGPLNVRIAPLAAEKPSSQLVARGRASAAELNSLVKMPQSVKLSGATNWQLSTTFTTAEATDEPGRSQPRTFHLESNLQGLGIDMPYPLGKSVPETRALNVDVEFDGEGEVLTRASLGELRSLVRIEKNPGGWRFDRGTVRPDAVAAALPTHPGLRIEGALDRLVLDDWFALRSDTPSQSRVSDFLKAANLRIGMLQLFGYQFDDVRGLLQADRSAWKIDVAGPSAEGELTIPEDFTSSQPLAVRLDHLVISREGKQSTPGGSRDPRSWPNLRAFVKDFRYEDHSIGAVDLQATRIPMGIRIDSLTVVQEAVRGDAQAQWIVTPDGERSQMSASIVSTDVGATLRALNYTPVLEAEHGEVTANLSWPGGFDGDFPTRASGSIEVSAEKGQVLAVQPGAGRMLGLFSVAALPRRLALDFSDLTDEGLSFDKVHGNFELRDGNAYTSNLLLRGPAAEIGMAGRVGLGTHDYDQTAVVTGNLGASLPIAGALAGGPAVGAAVLLFSQVFKEPLKGMTRGYYRITGPWENPAIERVDATQIKEASKEAAPPAREGAGS